METIIYASPEQVKCVNTLIGKLKLKDQKPAIINGASDDRTESSKLLYKTEATALIQYLKSQDPEEVRAEVMRRKIIGMAYERAGLPRDAEKEVKRKVVDWLNGWCKKYGYLHKALNSYTYKQLPTLVSQFQEVLKDLLIEY